MDPEPIDELQFPLEKLNDAVQLYLAIEDEQRRLAQLNEQLVEEGLDAPQHDMDYIMQSSKVEEMRNACRGLLTALPPARPKTPDLRAMSDWIEECRADFEACQAFCDAWSPLEEGEIDPQVERLLSRCNKLQRQVERLQERSKARTMAAIEDHTLSERAEKLCESEVWDSLVDEFWSAVEDGLTLPVGQRAVAVVQRELLEIERHYFTGGQPGDVELSADLHDQKCNLGMI